MKYLFFLFFIISCNNNEDFIIKDINVNFEGKINRKISIRKGLVTHVNITRFNKKDTIVFLGESIKNVKIGDSIIKHKSSPYFYLNICNDKNKYVYVRIPSKILLNKKFNNSWKDSCKKNWQSAMIK